MRIFLDTAETEEIRTAARWGVLDGVATNPYQAVARIAQRYGEWATIVERAHHAQPNVV